MALFPNDDNIEMFQQKYFNTGSDLFAIIPLVTLSLHSHFSISKFKWFDHSTQNASQRSLTNCTPLPPESPSNSSLCSIHPSSNIHSPTLYSSIPLHKSLQTNLPPSKMARPIFLYIPSPHNPRNGSRNEQRTQHRPILLSRRT